MRAILVLAFSCLATTALADRDPNRPTAEIAGDLNIAEAVFLSCFDPVQPAPDKAPSGARQRMNKSLLLGCLQAENPRISNDMLDTVMDRHRPEGPIRH